jgi:hypothetical protein
METYVKFIIRWVSFAQYTNNNNFLIDEYYILDKNLYINFNSIFRN